MGKLIDADALKATLMETKAESGNIGEVIVKIFCGVIDEQPEAVVRCKDCKHMVEHRWYGNLGESAYTCEGNMGGFVLPDDFCSYAGRRTDE